MEDWVSAAKPHFFRSPLAHAFTEFAEGVRERCLLCSPYISVEPVRRLLNTLQAKRLTEAIQVQIITDISPLNIIGGATDLNALILLTDNVRAVEMTYLPRVHAKVFVCDDQFALLGSANFTQGGADRNWEYGVRFTDLETVSQVRADMEAYAALGARVSPVQLREMQQKASAIREALAEDQQNLNRKRKDLALELQIPRVKELQRTLEDDLLGLRVAGKTINAIFSETILFLLAGGPQTANDLRDRVQDLHADICDSATERVIHGQSFGKLWKHQLRTARANLAQRGLIAYDVQQRVWHRL